MTRVAVQARALPRKPISFQRMITRIADRFGTEAAVEWTKTVVGHSQAISDLALRSAIASRNLQLIEAAVNPVKLQRALQRAMQPPLIGTVRTVGQESAQVLNRYGIGVQFNAAHSDVINFARQQAAELVADVPKEVKQVIAEVVARGAERGLTIEEQASAIKQVVGLPPNWLNAVDNFGVELQSGDIAAATSRRLSGRAKQQIRSAAKRGTLTDSFIQRMQGEYAESLLHRRALNIARTETLRSANHGLTQSWIQARAQGELPATARRFWLVTPDDRLSPEHARIPGMNPNGRGLNEPFFTTEGVHMYPPSRPNCRCTVGLGFVARRPR